eukprot:TRINITY_DN3347_c1_g1_i1.p1 TRINITY_DN3347_c1_g1~~TRINITY_DN3347_c1_g1_i1.p1  ORF type:complete len:251 (+),score=30.93 TRINITY_DN3347_c1_g1_i1:62-814(+)
MARIWFTAILLLLCGGVHCDEGPQAKLGDERIVMQTSMGEIELGFYVDAAPLTSKHMLECFKMGLFDSNHVFRVDKGFVAQVADAGNGRRAHMNPMQQRVAAKRVKGEFSKTIKHVRGVLSMGRWDDPDSATHSFSMMLGTMPHMDGVYAPFGEVTAGLSVLSNMETVETTKSGIFVMPKNRIEILSTYIYSATATPSPKPSLVISQTFHPRPSSNDSPIGMSYLFFGVVIGFALGFLLQKRAHVKERSV